MRRKDDAEEKPRPRRKLSGETRELLQDGTALVGVDLMREMLRMIREKKLSRQEIASRVVDMMEGKKAHEEAQKGRLTVLRERLDKLYEPQDEAARFRVEREIFDLEHAAACAEDEWPEVIAA
jgi:hypothetical protein